MYIVKDSIFKNTKTRTHDNIYMVGWELEENKNLTSYGMKNKR